MPITELNAHLKYKNTSGDTTVIYPITKADNIVGILPIASGGTGARDAVTACANLGAAPVFTYGTDDIVSGSASNKPDGTMHFVYATKDGVWDYVKSIFVTIDGVWRLVCDTSGIGSSDYTITTNLTGVTGASSNPTTIAKDGTASLTFTANSGYALPDSVTVTGATSNWNKSTGVLTLINPTGNVTVIITGVAAYTITTNLTGVTGASSNPTTIAKDGTATLYFTANTGYALPDSITVTGATYRWVKNDTGSLGVLTLSNPTGNVTVIITGVAATTTYTTTINVDGASYWTSPTATENASPLMTIAVGKYASGKLYFTYSYQGSQIGLYPADSTDVTAFKYNGTEYTSGQSFTIGGETGQNTVANIYTVETTTYTITTNLTGVTGASSNPTTIAKDGTASLTFTANSGYALPDSVTVTGASSNWLHAKGMLILSNPTGNVSVTVVATSSGMSEVTPEL